MGLTGKPFTVKHKDRVTEMTRAFLDYMKSLRLQAPEAINPAPVQKDRPSAEPESDYRSDAQPKGQISWNLKLTAQGYSILPTAIKENEGSKAGCEKLMRAYITQHYCRFISFIRSDPNLTTFRSGKREKE